ncbi:putative uncharacterized protein DDB_G0289263 [Microplitis demolitor]|uniref:putative uncharacterized protein DDB_G0289263 n=1 Tax=Microplitis demolitor TaxID=69319 RepID=UPI00235B5D60|nr:putative uncharacterized protein DDB_G0289263 [Microplitis demolitor]
MNGQTWNVKDMSSKLLLSPSSSSSSSSSSRRARTLSGGNPSVHININNVNNYVNINNSSNNSNADRKRNSRKPIPRPHETEEEAILRRFHDAQRMARFRAKKKKAMEEAKALEAAKLTELAMISELKRRNVVFQIKPSNNNNNNINTNNNNIINNNNNNNNNNNYSSSNSSNNNSNKSISGNKNSKGSTLMIKPDQRESLMAIQNDGQSKYSQLLEVIEELGRDIRLTYAGSRTSAERLKMGIIQARMLVRDCLLETEINLRQ